jgi:hypothetical protein
LITLAQVAALAAALVVELVLMAVVVVEVKPAMAVPVDSLAAGAEVTAMAHAA